jgi:membrane-bound ClpP family serine protease
MVLVDGSRWQATLISGETIASGETIEVVARDGLKLTVRKK